MDHQLGGLADPVSAVETGALTVVAGESFAVSGRAGDIRPGRFEGFFSLDTRVLCQLSLTVDGAPPRPLDVVQDAPQRIEIRSAVGDVAAPSLLVVRRRTLQPAHLEEVVELYRLTDGTGPAVVELFVGADFADLFDVKAGTTTPRGEMSVAAETDRLVLRYRHGSFTRSVTLRADREVEWRRDGMVWRVPGPEVGGHDALTVSVDVSDHGTPTATPRSPLAHATRPPADLTSSLTGLSHAWRRSMADLAALEIPDPEAGGLPVLAAGSPWFMALFGRDGLIAGTGSLILGTQRLLGTLRALAARQGRQVDLRSEEEPGRILHEVRLGEAVQGPHGWGGVYYGSVDATPLFVIALAEAWRWGVDPDEVAALLPAAEAAIAWVDARRAAGGGFVRYGGADGSSGALAQQAWKDSTDAIRHVDGTPAHGPLALVEVQGYAVAAYRALADLRRGHGGDPHPLEAAAADLADQLDLAFWAPAIGSYALALDGDNRRVESVASNPGHLLWAGAQTPQRAAPLAARLVGPDLFSGYGLRTLAEGHPAFNPLSYHRGSVWPHDTSLVAAGLLRVGQHEQGALLARGLWEAADCFDGRLPELFGGFSRTSFPRPVPYPSSCSPQAWAAAATPMLVTELLGLRPDLPNGRVTLTPGLPADAVLEVDVPLGAGRLAVSVGRGRTDVLAAPDGLDVQVREDGHDPRPPG